MKLILLGSEGAGHFPRPCCFCRECKKARAKNFERTGPALIETTQGILFDTPEEISQQLNREKIKKVSAVFYTHWHPDHTQGMRLFEHLGARNVFPGFKKGPAKQPVQVFIPEESMPDFKKYIPHIFYFEERGWIKISTVKNKEPIQFGDITVIPVNFNRPDRQRFGYVLMQGEKKAVYAPCSIFGMALDPLFYDADLFFMETGWIGNTQNSRIESPEKSSCRDHVSLEENIELAKKLKPKKAILTHIEGTQHMTTEKLEKFLKQFKKPNIHAAKEGMKFKL